jgi:hypothetical protein
MDGYLTLHQIAADLGMTDRGVLAAVKRGELPAELVGHTYIVRVADYTGFKAGPRRKPGYPRGRPRRKTSPPKETAP